MSLHVMQNELEAEIAEMHPALTLLLLVWRRYRTESAAAQALGIQYWGSLYVELCLWCMQFLVQICNIMAENESDPTGNLQSCDCHKHGSQRRGPGDGD